MCCGKQKRRHGYEVGSDGAIHNIGEFINRGTTHDFSIFGPGREREARGGFGNHGGGGVVELESAAAGRTGARWRRAEFDDAVGRKGFPSSGDGKNKFLGAQRLIGSGDADFEFEDAAFERGAGKLAGRLAEREALRKSAAGDCCCEIDSRDNNGARRILLLSFGSGNVLDKTDGKIVVESGPLGADVISNNDGVRELERAMDAVRSDVLRHDFAAFGIERANILEEFITACDDFIAIGKIFRRADEFAVLPAVGLSKFGLKDLPFDFDFVWFAVAPVFIVGIVFVIVDEVAKFDITVVV